MCKLEGRRGFRGRLSLVGLVLAAVLALAAPAQAAGAEPLVVGVLLPMTGQVAAYGQMCWTGIQIAHRMQPKALGRPVKLVVFPAKRGGKTFAVAFEGTGKGYHGDIGVMVGIDLKTDKLTGIAIVSQSETPGLGARIVEKSFTDPFKGQSLAKPLTKDRIHALSGATFSTNGVLAAVNQARDILTRYRKQMVQ